MLKNDSDSRQARGTLATIGEEPREVEAMASGTSKVLPSELLNLKDQLSRITFVEAYKLLGAQGRERIRRNANILHVHISDLVHLCADLLRVRFPAIASRAQENRDFHSRRRGAVLSRSQL